MKSSVSSFLSSLLVVTVFANSFLFAQSLMNVNSWKYQLQDININQIADNSTFELIVIDYSADGTDAGKFSAQEISQVKNSGKKAIAYISIGEAENYRYYWQSGWTTNPPPWLGAENPNWPGNYKVKFWDTNWQQIVYNYIDTIVSQGFDGIYMDIIDAYYYWQVENQSQQNADSLMIEFVAKLRSHISSSTTKEFYLIPQNGESVVSSTNVSQSLKSKYFNVINAVGVEDVFFAGTLDEDNPYTPDVTRMQQLQEYIANSKRVLSIEYLTQPTKIQQYISAARNAGYVSVTCMRALNSLCTEVISGTNEESSTEHSMSNALHLFQNYPNPFTTATTIRFSLPQSECVKLTLLNMHGHVVATLIDGVLSSGEHTVQFNSEMLSTGIYAYRLFAGASVQVRNALLIK
ncbi:MAG: MJ1477/TM1410 family putative glycoside hydrolase [bacterium]|nr:MJ1477/TM1410 family putative glycoside hydrolase [bacterium]